MKRYLIIGNSAAAAGCIEGIRQADKDGEITLISKEPHAMYSRPLISYLMAGKTDEEKMLYRPHDFYQKNGVKALLGKTAVTVDAKNKQVTLEDKEKIGYDKLFISTGSKPFVPPIKGLETVKNKFTFMSLDDAHELDKVLTSRSRVLIVGAGLIGLKCAEGIINRAGSVTVCDIAKRVLPNILDEDCAERVKKHLEENKIRFMLGDSVAEFKGNTAVFQSGAAKEFDIVVIAVGVRPNTELALSAGAAVNRGIIVDERNETTVKDIYCAGDCSEGNDSLLGEKRILALLPNAYLGGECAGINMAGGSAAFDNAIPMNAIGFFGLHIISAGVYDGACERIENEEGIKKLYYKDDTLRGFIMVGNVERAGIYTALIRNKTPLSSIDFEFIKEKPQLLAFAKKDRAQMLNGKN